MTNPTQALIEAARAAEKALDPYIAQGEQMRGVEVSCADIPPGVVLPQLWHLNAALKARDALRSALLHQDEAQRREDACFECGAELHAPFCPACNPEMVRPSPSWPSKEEIARTLFDKFGVQCGMPELAMWRPIARAALALFPAPTQEKTP